MKDIATNFANQQEKRFSQRREDAKKELTGRGRKGRRGKKNCRLGPDLAMRFISSYKDKNKTLAKLRDLRG